MTPQEAQALIGAAGAADATVAEDVGPAPGPQTIEGDYSHVDELEEENKALLGMALEFASPVLPFLPTIYTPAVIERIAKAGAKVEKKYGVSIGAIFGRYQDEAMLALAVLPPTVTAIVTARAYIEKKKAEAKASADGTATKAPAAS